jgi:hypothetical protein
MPGKNARKAVTTTTTTSVVTPQKMHLDKRAEMILIVLGAGADDLLLSTKELAMLMGVSVEWLENGRIAGYGPEYTKIGPHMIKYQLGKARKFLRQRTYLRTSDYR